MVSPATTPTVRGRKKGIVMVKPARAANTPLRVTWSRKVGPLPACGPPERYTARARAAGTTARTASRAIMRRRRNWVASSARHIEALSGQGHKRVLQGGPDGREAAHADIGLHEGPAQLFGALAVQ